MTRSELRARILHGLNEDATSPVFFSTSEIDSVIDEAAEVLAEEAAAIKRTVVLPMQDGTMFYSLRGLASDCMQITRVWDETNTRRLERTTMADLDARHQTWMTVTGDPWRWFPVSWDLFGLWPAPSTGGDLLTVEYLAWPRALLHDDDRPEFLDVDHDALVAYGVYDGAMKRWDAITGLTAWNAFLQSWGQAKDRSGADRLRARIWQTPAVGESSGYRVRVE